MSYSPEEFKDTSKTRSTRRFIFNVINVVGILALIALFNPLKHFSASTPIESEQLCPMPPKFKVKELEKVQYILSDPVFRNISASKLSDAVKIDTVVYDIMSDFSKFQKFHQHLEKAFPLVHKYATIHKPNTYGLVFEFKGTNPDLKPIMLSAHQDTVPIGDPSDWTRDPFSGDFDEEKVYGRGTGDCKNLLIGLMEAMEMLLEDGQTVFERGILLTFGFDEERSGLEGAKSIARFLESYLGYDSVEFIMDEGLDMYTEHEGEAYGLIMTGEKGYIDLQVEINTPGGHSSVPKQHNSVGMLSYFVTQYEEELYSPLLDDNNPILKNYECMAEYGHLPRDLILAIRTAKSNPKSKQYLIDYILDEGNPQMVYTIRTSQAVDIFNGGDKVNSLPREATAFINHRIAYGNDDQTIKNKAIEKAKQTAFKFGIGLTAFGREIIKPTDEGNMIITILGDYLRPAPISPSDDQVWNSVTGSIKAFYEDIVYPERFTDKEFIITPSVMPPNTDTRHYWNLTTHIYKVQPGFTDLFKANAHSHDEWIHIDTHLQTVGFYYDFISKYCN